MMCPLCAASVEVEARACSSCGTDLREYATVHYHPDVLFNDALRRLGRGQHAEAAALLAAVASWRPDDAEALGLWAEAALGRGEPGEAVRILLAAADLAPGPALDERLADALAAVDAATGPGISALMEIAARLRADIVRLEAGWAAGAVPTDPACPDSRTDTAHDWAPATARGEAGPVTPVPGLGEQPAATGTVLPPLATCQGSERRECAGPAGELPARDGPRGLDHRQGGERTWTA
jgi:hypothetical protein